mmetsp:Transcript_17621/g.16963  ORF Transcript_17621/g.16963 Transcript_17621/m.16963 type:complete len:205 (-) Transcript_17621:394-1008(-)
MKALFSMFHLLTYTAILGLRMPTQRLSATTSQRLSQRYSITSKVNSDMSEEQPKEWFSKGLSFSCSMCGNCCSGSSGSVRFSEAEAEGMASQVNMKTDDFYAKFTRRQGRGSKTYYELKEVRQDDGSMDCIFLDRLKITGKAICSINTAKPMQCKTWPFWPEILETEKTWNDAKKGAEGCPGLGKGTVVPFEEIIRQRDETAAS